VARVADIKTFDTMPTSNPAATRPDLTDRSALSHQRQRAARGKGDFFLHAEAIVECQERLSVVNRRFTSPAVVAGHAGPWLAAFPDAVHAEDRDVLDLTQGAHDLVVHGLCLHWANDPVGQLIQSRRALQPDGLFLGFLPAGRTLFELRQALAEAEAEITGGLSPRVLPMAEIRDLGGLLQRAGFVLPVADMVTLRASYESPLHLMRDLRAMGEANAMAARPRRGIRRAVLLRACEIYTRHFPDTDGRVAATFEIACLTGWAPGPGQPQPLRPGSATARLADALGTDETRLPDRAGD